MNIYNTEKMIGEISLLYDDSEYEKDLFVIFRYVTMCEKYIMYHQLRGIDTSRKKFIIDLVDLLVDFRNKNMDIKYDTLSIKNKIMVISIIRKIFIINNSQNSLLMINIDQMMLPSLSELITTLNNNL